MIYTKPEGSWIQCKPDKFANFLSSLVFLLIFGFAWGHISQSPKKLLRILNKMYAYIILPALALVSPTTIKAHMKEWTNSSITTHAHVPLTDNPVVRIIIIDFIVKATLWVTVVFGLWAVYRNSTILKSAALSAQFIIHGNDIGFSKALLEATCRWVSPIGNHTDAVDFSPIEVPTNTMNFLIFLPLTHGLVGMCAQRRPTLKVFVQQVLRQMGKFGFSYICLIVGIIIAALSSDPVKMTDRLSSFEGMISMLQVLLTLMCGVYIYYLTMNCNWGNLSVIKTMLLTVAVTFVYPVLHYIIYHFWTKEKPHMHDHETVLIGHSSTPSSIFVQIYILKHLRCPTNFIAAFLLTTVFGGLLMYCFIIVNDKAILATYYGQNISPVDFYVTKDQWEFKLTSTILLIVFGMLIYARFNHTSVLRKLIFITLLVELLTDVVSMTGSLVINSLYHDIPIPITLGNVLSAVMMMDHIGATGMIVLIFMYKRSSMIKRFWKHLMVLIFIAAVSVPIIIHTVTYLCFKKNIQDNTLFYNNKSITFFLDLRSKENRMSDENISKPIGVISYTIINAIALCIYTAAAYVSHNMTRSSMESEDLIENIEDPEDTEKYTSCKILFSYQFCVIIMAIAFGIRNIHYTKAMKDNKWADDILEFIELSSLILADLAGAAMTIIFCISPGNMEREINRFLYIPSKIKGHLLRCTDDMDASIDISKLSLGDLDRCRRFVLYHKTAFIAHYPPLDQDNHATFQGRNLVAFLVETGVADSQGEAVNLADSYLKGRVIMTDDGRHPLRGGLLAFVGDNTTYTLVSDDEMPDFSEILQNRAIQERPFHYMDYD